MAIHCCDHCICWQVVVSCLVKLGSVATVDRHGHPLQKAWYAEHDSACVPPECGMVKSGLTEHCVTLAGGEARGDGRSEEGSERGRRAVRRCDTEPEESAAARSTTGAFGGAVRLEV